MMEAEGRGSKVKQQQPLQGCILVIVLTSHITKPRDEIASVMLNIFNAVKMVYKDTPIY